MARMAAKAAIEHPVGVSFMLCRGHDLGRAKAQTLDVGFPCANGSPRGR
jgi:hypothetical protein